MDDFISAQIRRTNRNLLLMGGALIIAVGAVVGACWRDSYNFIFGPFPMSNAELTSIWNPAVPKHYFVKVHGQESYATGAQAVAENNHDRVLAEFVALSVDNRLLLVKTPTDNHQVEFTGTLTAVPEQLQNGLFHRWDEKHPDRKGAFLPLMLDATGNFRGQDNILLAFAGFFFGGGGLLLAGISLWRRMNPEKHPLLKKLAQYGPVQDVQMRIDSTVRAEGGGEKFGSLQITSNWLINAAAYTTSVMAISDVIWAYPKITKHYHSGIPTGKSYSAIIRDNKGQSVEVSGKKDSVPKLLASLQQRMPWILIGFSQELDTLWRKEKPKFMQMIQQRRASLPAPAR